MPDVLLIADDLTGAADSGVTFAEHGAEVLVAWDAGQLPDADVAVFTTESRNGSPEEARQRVRRVLVPLVGGLGDSSFLIYKKIDSTLRGHPGVELAEILNHIVPDVESTSGGDKRERVLPGALVAPAFPAQGRVTRGGTHFVHEWPLAETVFGREVRASEVRDYFLEISSSGMVSELSLSDVREGLPSLVAALTTSGARVVIADAETETDLRLLAHAALQCGIRVLCGSAGLAEALADQMADECGWTSAKPAVPVGGDGAVLVVAGSRHPQTQRQLDAIRAKGIPVLTPPLAWSQNGAVDGTSIQEALGRALCTGTAVLTTVGLPDMDCEVASRLAELVATSLCSRDASVCAIHPDHPQVSGLVLTGGDIAMAVSRALGVQALKLHGEVSRGMPWGCLVGGMGDGLPVVTKAGGFGRDDALVVAVDFLRGADHD